MKKQDILPLIEEFSKETHGRTDYGKDTLYVMGDSPDKYAPFRFLSRKIESLGHLKDLQKIGYVFSSYDHAESQDFKKWYEHQFQKKLLIKTAKDIHILYAPDQIKIFNALEAIFENYEYLREMSILLNGKNLPVQVGEWYAKNIFGLTQIKSTSQRGFDFHKEDKKVEVKVHWSDHSSPKGVKVKRSAIELSDYIVLMHVSNSFMIRDICLLDSDFVERKFSGKGHTVFLKDVDINNYFFSRSDKHFDKVVNKNVLMKFASPTFAMKLSGRF